MRLNSVLTLIAAFFLLPGCGENDKPGDAEGNQDDAEDDDSDDDDGSGGGDDGDDDTSDDGETSDTGETDDGGSDDGDTDDGGTDGDIEVFPFRVDFTPPTDETYYACFPISIPTSQVVHLVGFRPAIESAQVHHYVLGLLEGGSVEPGSPCWDWPGTTIWGWSPGIGEWLLPDDVGFPSGEDGTVDLMLQIHYNNPLGQEVHDTSGVDILYTNTLREHDAGVLTIGDIANLEIPPDEEAFEHVATCPAAQTTTLLSEPINVFAAWLHAHEIGSEIWTEQYRDGTMLGEIGHDDPFVFEMQHFQPVDAVIEPGDELRTHCVFDSTSRDAVTTGGYGTTDEMCVNFLFYYPAVAGQRCGAL